MQNIVDILKQEKEAMRQRHAKEINGMDGLIQYAIDHGFASLEPLPPPAPLPPRAQSEFSEVARINDPACEYSGCVKPITNEWGYRDDGTVHRFCSESHLSKWYLERAKKPDAEPKPVPSAATKLPLLPPPTICKYPDLKASDAKAIELAKDLSGALQVETVSRALEGSYEQAQKIIAEWVNMDWLKKGSKGWWIKTATFGGTKAKNAPESSHGAGIGNLASNPTSNPTPEPETATSTPNGTVTAASEQGVKIGLTLQEPFGARDIEARLDGHGNLSANQRANIWLAEWLRRGWVKSAGFRAYRRTEKYGQTIGKT